MKHRFVLALVAGFALVALASWSALAGEEPTQGEPETTTSTFHVSGMTCGGCEVGVRRVVGKLEGIESVDASYENETATVIYRADEVTPDDIIAAIEGLGYTAELASDGEDET